MKIALVAAESAGLQVLRALGRSSHRLVAVLTAPPNGTPSSTLWGATQDMGIEYWPARIVKEPALANRHRAEQGDILEIVHLLYVIDHADLTAPLTCSLLH